MSPERNRGPLASDTVISSIFSRDAESSERSALRSEDSASRLNGLLQGPPQHLVEVVGAVLALDAEAPRGVAAAVQPALHLFANAHVFRLHLVRHGHAVLN